MSTPVLVLPDEPDPPRHYRLEISRLGKKWITSNKRLNPYAKARMVKDWREIASWRGHRDLGSLNLEKSYVVCELRMHAKRRRDPANWEPTAKAVMDGLVDAGVFVDDDHTHVTGPDMRIGKPAAGLAEELLVIHIWPLEAP